ncbi:hypothetical protein [Tenacibaculum sp. M341]|uniref:hypothetical protein n=1 Tax=Tenacibaculum sp. M341 TaxID=2530339 RepID=UPI001A9CF571|nr:hypothetical protein [Tenacibaculum sp. M341]
MKQRIMFIEPGGGLDAYDARIGLVTFSKTGKTIKYGNQEFQSLKGMGYKCNYYDLETGEEYWISGPKKNGEDALYPLDIEIDEDIREAYWIEIRNRPDLIEMATYNSKGKYTKRTPNPEFSLGGTTRKGTNRGGDKIRRK